MEEQKITQGPNSLKPEATSRTSLAVIKEGAAKIRAYREQKALESLQNSPLGAIESEGEEVVTSSQKPLKAN